MEKKKKQTSFDITNTKMPKKKVVAKKAPAKSAKPSKSAPPVAASQGIDKRKGVLGGANPRNKKAMEAAGL